MSYLRMRLHVLTHKLFKFKNGIDTYYKIGEFDSREKGYLINAFTKTTMFNIESLLLGLPLLSVFDLKFL